MSARYSLILFLNSVVLPLNSSWVNESSFAYSALIFSTTGWMCLMSRSDLLPNILLKNFNIFLLISNNQVLVAYLFPIIAPNLECRHNGRTIWQMYLLDFNYKNSCGDACNFP